MRVEGWIAEAVGQPLRRTDYDAAPADSQVLVEVAGCGVCHTDLGYLYEGVPTRHPFPLVLGHEVSGTVVEAGAGADEWLERDVVVPAVIPCEECATCRDGRGSICPDQVFPGNDLDGGFATHLVVPAKGLCPVPNLADATVNPAGLSLELLAVIADAVSTPFQAIDRSRLAAGDLAIFVGAGGVGGFGVQIAAARGAHVVGIDVDPQRLEVLQQYGLALALDASELDFKQLRQEVAAIAEEHGVPTYRWRIFECSGTPAGQATAFGLLRHGGYLGVVGYTPRKVELRLSNLMALDAVAEGNWGCLPAHYPAIVDLVLAGEVVLEPFVERRPLDAINETLEQLHAGGMARRPILIPEN